MTAADTVHAERVLLVAPTRRDGDVTCALLRRAGIQVEAYDDLRALIEQIDLGLGALMLTDLALTDPAVDRLIAALNRQPPWSDVPVVLLTQDRERSPTSSQVLGQLSNVTLLDRPTSIRTMVSAVLAALRARRRQYEIRDHLQAQQAAQRALREADRRKDEFLATLAHELRNPLAPIRTGLHLLSLQPGTAGSPAAGLAQMMERQISLLVKLIDDLLDVSRISTGKLVLQRETVDMREVVQAALEGSRPAIDAGEHVFHADTGSEPIWVHGDSQRLAQVISNLLNNAAKYTPAGGRIALELSSHDGQAVVRVQDTGAGIPPDMLENVFEMFTQVHRTLGHAQGGLGIGLPLVRRLVELHGGNVTADSRGPGHGSTFTVRIPSAPAPVQDEPRPALPAAPARSPARVLVVDDNADAANTLVDWLQQAGHLAQAAYSGENALELAAELTPEVVLCDIGLPGIDGHEVAMRLRRDKRHADALLVAITGWGSKADKRRTRQAGFDFHLVKPVRVEQVEEILARR
jgi:two-component system, sensor histidine kinase